MDAAYKEFVFRGAPTEWLDYAAELFHAADALYVAGHNSLSVSSNQRGEITKRTGHSRVTIFLFALSIENLLKGILVAENPHYLSNGILSREVSGGFHSLVALSKKLKSSPVKRTDIRLLRVLESSIPSWGRYPIPKNYRDIKHEQLIDDKFSKRVRNLFRALERHLYQIVKNGWKGPHGIILKSSFYSDYEDEK